MGETSWGFYISALLTICLTVHYCEQGKASSWLVLLRSVAVNSPRHVADVN